jgi:hypothetical protein
LLGAPISAVVDAENLCHWFSAKRAFLELLAAALACINVTTRHHDNFGWTIHTDAAYREVASKGKFSWVASLGRPDLFAKL